MRKNKEIRNSYPYFKSISLSNIRSFGSKQTIELNSRWNIITGENGTGKTTILKALALPLFFQNRWENSLKYLTLDDFRRNGGSVKGEIEYEVESVFPRKDFKLSTTFQDILSYKDNDKFPHLNILAFGAVRPISKKGISSEQEFPAFTLFEENNTIWNPEEWLILAKYRVSRDVKFKEILPIIEDCIKNIMPDISEIRYPKEGRARVEFKTPYGWVEYHQLSLGTRTLTSIMIEFIDRLIKEYYASPLQINSVKSPFEIASILIIDEADSHLFPMLIGKSFRYIENTFPNTQFIIATNNLAVLELTKEFTEKNSINVIRLVRNGDEVNVKNISKDVYGKKYNHISKLYL